MALLKCKMCGGSLEIPEGSSIAYCQYCGTKLEFDNGNKTTTHNYNRTYTRRDETRIRESERKEKVCLKELEYKEQKEKRELRFILLGFGIAIAAIALLILGFGINTWISKAQGKISVGYYYDYTGENYEAVVEQFEAMGFENIVTIDLDDAGLNFSKNEKVKSVSINGDSDFSPSNYFYPTDKVIIKYH